MNPRVTVITAGGAEKLLPAPADRSQLVSDWLAAHGVALNMRCGGRGRCRGCLVEAGAGHAAVRACQTTFGQLPNDTITIPPASCADHTLHGVSDFEVRAGGVRPKLRPGLGLALDIGTTTVAGALWDLAAGTCLATASRGNAQRRHGDDIVSRITFAVENEAGLDRLHRALVNDTLAPLIKDLTCEAKVAAGLIREAVAAGNPTMLHTLARESLAGLATYPFRPVFLGERTLTASDVGLDGDYRLQLLPGLGPFVGSDITAGALAAGLLEPRRGPALLMDFGTNGELLLRTSDGYLAAAAAAGPAFEGGRLRHGATARAGVISSLRLEGGVWKSGVIGGSAHAHGISGAAYVDFLAEAWRAGILNEFGRFDRSCPDVRPPSGEETTGCLVSLGNGLDVSESDVAEILQAKAAIAGGVNTLLELAGLQPHDLETVLVAGGFGYNLDMANALAIGLLPRTPPDRVELIGNASLGGASLVLQTDDMPALSSLRTLTRTVELNQIPSFEEHFTAALALGTGGH